MLNSAVNCLVLKHDFRTSLRIKSIFGERTEEVDKEKFAGLHQTSTLQVKSRRARWVASWKWTAPLVGAGEQVADRPAEILDICNSKICRPGERSSILKKKLRWSTLGYHHDWDSKVWMLYELTNWFLIYFLGLFWGKSIPLPQRTGGFDKNCGSCLRIPRFSSWSGHSEFLPLWLNVGRSHWPFRGKFRRSSYFS